MMALRIRCPMPILVAVFILGHAWILPVASWAATSVPGTRLAMDPPAGFQLSQVFTGFEGRVPGVTIVVTEIPEPVADDETGFARRELAAAGLSLHSFEEVGSGASKARLLAVSQIVSGERIEKWMLLLGNISQSILIVASYPYGESKSLSGSLRRALLSARWDPLPPAVGLEGLPFHVAETDNLKIVRRLANMLVLAESITKMMSSSQYPLLIVGLSNGSIETTDIEAFAKQRLQSAARVEEITISSGQERTINSLPAFELTATAKDIKTANPLVLYQMLFVDGTRYFLLQGYVGKPKANEFVPEFRKIANSFSLKP